MLLKSIWTKHASCQLTINFQILIRPHNYNSLEYSITINNKGFKPTLYFEIEAVRADQTVIKWLRLQGSYSNAPYIKVHLWSTEGTSVLDHNSWSRFLNCRFLCLWGWSLTTLKIHVTTQHEHILISSSSWFSLLTDFTTSRLAHSDRDKFLFSLCC